MCGGKIEISVEPPPGAQFSRQQSNHRQTRPLAEAERLKELLLGMLKRRTYGIDSGNWQASTSVLQIGVCGKLLRSQKESNVSRSLISTKTVLKHQSFRYIQAAVPGVRVLYLICCPDT